MQPDPSVRTHLQLAELNQIIANRDSALANEIPIVRVQDKSIWLGNFESALIAGQTNILDWTHIHFINCEINTTIMGYDLPFLKLDSTIFDGCDVTLHHNLSFKDTTLIHCSFQATKVHRIENCAFIGCNIKSIFEGHFVKCEFKKHHETITNIQYYNNLTFDNCEFLNIKFLENSSSQSRAAFIACNGDISSQNTLPKLWHFKGGTIKFKDFIDFKGVLITNCDINGSDFSGSTVYWDFFIYLISGKHSNISTKGIIVKGDGIGKTLEKYNFTKVTLEEVTFSHLNLNGFDFSHANLRGCNFNNVDIYTTVFCFANLTNVSFQDIRRVDLRNFSGTSLISATLPERIINFEA